MSVSFSLYIEFLLDFPAASELVVMQHHLSSSRRQYYFTNKHEAPIFLVSMYECWKL